MRPLACGSTRGLVATWSLNSERVDWPNIKPSSDLFYLPQKWPTPKSAKSNSGSVLCPKDPGHWKNQTVRSGRFALGKTDTTTMFHGPTQKSTLPSWNLRGSWKIISRSLAFIYPSFRFEAQVLRERREGSGDRQGMRNGMSLDIPLKETKSGMVSRGKVDPTKIQPQFIGESDHFWAQNHPPFMKWLVDEAPTSTFGHEFE